MAAKAMPVVRRLKEWWRLSAQRSPATEQVIVFDIENTVINRQFTFNRGSWHAGHNVVGPLDGENDMAGLTRAGYSPNGAYYGGEHGLRLEIFENSVDGSFFAFISPTGRTTVEVLIPDFESFMLFIKDYGGSFAAAGSEATQKVGMETLAKLFGALHGHDWSEACQLCDPVGWRRWNGMQDSG